ncbi:hypothetical protein, partial [Neptuniibacter sp.]|uniref:hypothetical protein n=1 Tax=Neptuniibacter sp. TaxID=1962643 RepID=UPI0026221058
MRLHWTAATFALPTEQVVERLWPERHSIAGRLRGQRVVPTEPCLTHHLQKEVNMLANIDQNGTDISGSLIFVTS